VSKENNHPKTLSHPKHSNFAPHHVDIIQKSNDWC